MNLASHSTVTLVSADILDSPHFTAIISQINPDNATAIAIGASKHAQS